MGGAQHMMAWIIIQIPPTVKSSYHHGADEVVQILLPTKERKGRRGKSSHWLKGVKKLWLLSNQIV